MGHLGLSDWHRIELHDELDFLGPIAREGLSAHGLLWPANAHFHVPIFRAAAGGTVLTGADGDGLFASWRWHHAAGVLGGKVAPAPRDALRVALAVAPRPVKRAVILRRLSGVPWLTPVGVDRARRAVAQSAATEPLNWEDRTAWFRARRHLRIGFRSLDLLAASHDIVVGHPLVDARVLAAFGRAGGRAGWPSREAAMSALFGDLLPAESLTRRSKAEFGGALWGPEARRHADAWDGGGVDPELVDACALRGTWNLANPPLAAATLLQGAWLSRPDLPASSS